MHAENLLENGILGVMKMYPDCIHKDPLQMGAEFLDFVMEILQKRGVVLQAYTSKKNQYAIGESLQGWEVKLDNRFIETGRLSIEVAEKSKAENPDWIKSGIYRRDNTWIYIQGNYNRFYWFQKSILIGLHKSGKYEEAESYGTIKKFYLPISDADKYGIKFEREIK